MNNAQTQQQFILLRAEGRSFARIAEDLKVSKPTLINWSRKFQFEIQNQRAINAEALQEKWLASREARVDALGEQLQRIQAELDKRDLASLPTRQLFYVAQTLRREIKRETGLLEFSAPVSDIPDDEFHEQVQDWRP